MPPQCANIRERGQTDKESDMEQYKTCKGCEQIQPISNFHKARDNSDGLRNSCKACTKAKDKARYQANSEEQKQRALKYYHDHKEERAVKSAEWYRLNKDEIAERRKARRLQNIWHYKKLERKSYERNADNRRAFGREWSKANPDKTRAKNQRRRARLLEAKTFAITAKEIKALYESKCLFCESTNRIDIDHAIPLSRGGSHGIGNLIPLCDNCNSTKYNKTIMEWRVYRIRIGKPVPIDKGRVL